MAEVVQKSLERMLSELEELKASGIFNESEIGYAHQSFIITQRD